MSVIHELVVAAAAAGGCCAYTAARKGRTAAMRRSGVRVSGVTSTVDDAVTGPGAVPLAITSHGLTEINVHGHWNFWLFNKLASMDADSL